MARRDRAAALFAAASTIVSLGCAQDDPAPAPPELASELSRPIDPPIAVDPDPDIGAVMQDVQAAATAGSDSSYSPTYGSCVLTHFEREGLVIAVFEHCVGSHSRLFTYRFVPGAPPIAAVGRAFGDADDDALVDAWFDPDRGLLIEDVNRDAIVDRRSQAFEHIEGEVSLEGFDPSFTPPPHLGERIFEDTDYDGLFDTETITGGEDPEGNPTYWQRG
jgi:hypothetical protein